MITHRRALFFTAALCAVNTVGGCSRDDTLSPPQARPGVDACAACGMMLADTRFAAALAFRDDAGAVQRRIYDDAGEMLAVDPPTTEHVFFVMAFDAGVWIPAADAIYVHARSVMTPMATGVTTFADRAAAEAFTREHNGVVLAYTDARARAAAGALGVDSDARTP